MLVWWFLSKTVKTIIGTTRLHVRSSDDDTLDRQREVSMRFLEFLFVLDIKGFPPQIVVFESGLINLFAG